jgi:hypothetical protein
MESQGTRIRPFNISIYLEIGNVHSICDQNHKSEEIHAIGAVIAVRSASAFSVAHAAASDEIGIARYGRMIVLKIAVTWDT